MLALMNVRPGVITMLVTLTALAAVHAAPPPEARGFAGGGLRLFPLGWSADGRWAALVGRADDSGPVEMRVIVVDAITDELVHESDPLPWSAPDAGGAFWEQHGAAVNTVVSRFNLDSSRRPDVRDALFATGGPRYELRMNPPSPAAGPYSLRITSSRGDAKEIYQSPPTPPLEQSTLLGALISPFEQRALGVILEETAGGAAEYRFVGAHLLQGFSSRRPGKLLPAVLNGQSYLVRARLDAGADPNERDERGDTVLLVAARLRHWGMAEVLVEAGAEPNLRDRDGRTALHYAAFAGAREAIRALIAGGADTAIRDGANRLPAELAADPAVRSLILQEDS